MWPDLLNCQLNLQILIFHIDIVISKTLVKNFKSTAGQRKTSLSRIQLRVIPCDLHLGETQAKWALPAGCSED